MRFPPKEVVALWPAPNYVNPEVRGPAFIVVQSILLIISTTFLCMRIYARVQITRARLGVDDIFIMLAWLFAVALTTAVTIAITHYGWEVHIYDLNPSVAIMSRKVSWISMVFYALTSTSTKLSLLVFYLRILVAKVDKRVTKATMVIVVVYFFAVIVVLFAQCRPFGYYWNIYNPSIKGHCISEGPHMVTSATLNLILDLIIFFIPLRSLLMLKIRTSQKLQVLGLFLAGVLVIVAATIRLYFVVVVFLQTYDVTWYGYMTWLFSCAEIWIGLICACVPSCRAFFVSWNRGSLGSGSRSRAISGGTTGFGTAAGSRLESRFQEEDVRGLTTHSSRNGTGNETKIVAGSMKSDSEFSDEEIKHGSHGRMGGVRVQMEVLQFEEFEDGRPRRTITRNNM